MEKRTGRQTSDSNSQEFVGYTMKLEQLSSPKINKRDKKYQDINDFKWTGRGSSFHNSYNPSYKRMKIEKLFENLNLDESKRGQNNSRAEIDEEFKDSKCFSIEIHKVHHYNDFSPNFPRRRKKPKKVKTKHKSLDKQMDIDVKSLISDHSCEEKPIIDIDNALNTSKNDCSNWSIDCENNGSQFNKSNDTISSSECEEKKESNPEIDVEMDSTYEIKTRCINIKIKDKKDHIIFEKQMVLNEDNIKIKPFLSLIEEFCSKDKSLVKYKELFKKFLYKKFKIPELETLIDKDDKEV